MITKIEKVFRSPYSVPNGLQVTDDGLWIVDQITDRVALVEITADEDYTVPKLIRDIPSESSNTSGMTYGDGALWLAANGSGERCVPSEIQMPRQAKFLRLILQPVKLSDAIRYPTAVEHTGSNTTTTMKDISGSRRLRIRSRIR